MRLDPKSSDATARNRTAARRGKEPAISIYLYRDFQGIRRRLLLIMIRLTIPCVWLSLLSLLDPKFGSLGHGASGME